MKLDKRMTRQEKGSLVTSTLAKVGLLECCNTRIGDTVKGKTLSGGEKKRLSFAAELLTSPMLLYCDEPTTGLGTAIHSGSYLGARFIRTKFLYFNRCLQCTATCENTASSYQTRNHHNVYDSSALKSTVCHVP